MNVPVSRESIGTIVRGFRHRGHENVSRIEGFSDAVFGFSVTLLVVSLQVPHTFDELLKTLAGFPAFALTFAMLAQLWYLQSRFFRRYGLQDGVTVFLNLVLLFVVVFFTYPLKFLFGFAVGASSVRADQIVAMYGVYALGYAAAFGLFFLLYAHAYRRREELALTPVEAFDTRVSMMFSAMQIGIAALSVGAAAILSARHAYEAAAMVGGYVYVLVPLGIRTIKHFTERKRPRADIARTAG